MNIRGFFELFKVLEKNNCEVLNLQETDYQITTDKLRVSGPEFLESGLGELAKPEIKFSENKIKANLLFRKPGTVKSNDLGISTYTWSNKTIFLNREMHIDFIGVVVPVDSYMKLKRALERFRPKLEYSEMNNKVEFNAVAEVKGNRDFLMLKIDISPLKPFLESKAERYMAIDRDIENLQNKCLNLFVHKMLKKAMNEVQKRAKEIMPLKSKLNQKFSGLSQEMLEDIKESGVNLSTGAYEKQVVASDEELIEADDSFEAIEIKFKIKYINEKGLTAVNLLSENNESILISAGLSSELAKSMTKKISKMKDMLNQLKAFVDTNSESEIKDCFKKINKEKDRYTNLFEKLKKQLWMYKVSVSQEDFEDYIDENWALLKTSKKTNSRTFVHKSGEASLEMQVINLPEEEKKVV